jgi:hypothetical protein
MTHWLTPPMDGSKPTRPAIRRSLPLHPMAPIQCAELENFPFKGLGLVRRRPVETDPE